MSENTRDETTMDQTTPDQATMDQTTQENTNSIADRAAEESRQALSKKAGGMGLDVGTSRIVVARSGESKPEFASQLNAFVAIPFSNMTLGSLLREQIPHRVEGGKIIVYGNEASKFAAMLNAEIRRPMTRGVLDASEPDSLNVIRELLSTLLGECDAFDDPSVTFTVPAAPLGAEGSLTFHERTLKQILKELGYKPAAINEGLAVVYSELEQSNYTGIGISCGGGLCNVCLSYLSVPVLSFSVPKAGDFIDRSAAEVTGERANRIRLSKEDSFHFNGYFADKTNQVISVYYEDMIQTLVASLDEAFHRASNLPKFDRPIPLVLSGGTAMPEGFRDRFAKLLDEQEFPVSVSEIRLASDPLNATANGALQCALSEVES